MVGDGLLTGSVIAVVAVVIVVVFVFVIFAFVLIAVSASEDMPHFSSFKRRRISCSKDIFGIPLHPFDNPLLSVSFSGGFYFVIYIV